MWTVTRAEISVEGEPLRLPDTGKAGRRGRGGEGPRRRVPGRAVSVCGPDGLSRSAEAVLSRAGPRAGCGAAAVSLRAPRGGPSGRAGAASSSRPPAPPRSPETRTRRPHGRPSAKGLQSVDSAPVQADGRRAEPSRGRPPRPHHRPRPPRCPRPLGRLQAPPPGLTSGTKRGQRAGPQVLVRPPPVASGSSSRSGSAPCPPRAPGRPASPPPQPSAQPWPLLLGAASGAAAQQRASP